MNFFTETINGQASGNWRAMQAEAARYRQAKITVQEYTSELMESEKQRKWLNGVAIPYLADRWGHSREWVKVHLKLCCGGDLFTAREIKFEGRPFWIISSENELTIRQAHQWIENILDYKPCFDAGLEPPDPDWRKRKAV